MMYAGLRMSAEDDGFMIRFLVEANSVNMSTRLDDTDGFCS